MSYRLHFFSKSGLFHQPTVAGEPPDVGGDVAAQLVAGGVAVVGHGAGYQRRHVYVLRVSPGPFRSLGKMVNGGSGVLQRAPGEYHAIGYLPAYLQHSGADGSVIDGHLAAHRLEPQVEALDVVHIALVLDIPVAQDAPHDVGTFPHPLNGPDELQAVLRLHLNLVAAAQAENEAAVGEVVHRRGGHGDGRRGADEHAGDAGAKLDAAGGDRAGGEYGELIAAVPLGHPGRFVAQVFRQFHAFYDVRRRHSAGKSDSDPFHNRILPGSSSR